MGTIGAAALLPASGSAIAAGHKGKPISERIALGNTHFLSKTNPIATADQRAIEATALEMMQLPIIRDAREQAAYRFKTLAGAEATAEAMRGFDERMEEWTFHYVQLALVSDPNYPRILGSDYGPPHEWFGMKVPGCRGPGTGENADNNYSVTSIDPNARYELYGQRQSPAIGDSPLHLVTCLSMGMNAASFDSRDIKYKSDGSFVVTIDNTPAKGRANHIQSTIDTRYLFIRDGRVDWKQTPNAYRIHRIDPPAAPPLTKEQYAALAARFIVDDVAMNYFFTKMVRALPVNTVALPARSNLFGGQPLQKLARGHLKLDDDEAFVLTITPGGSHYHVLMLYDFWLMSGNFWSRTSSMNATQSAMNADGTYTYVFSITDPGVHNWIDVLDLHEPTFLIRFQLLPRNADGSYGGTTTTSSQLVKLKDLASVLPKETRWVTADERRQQLDARLAAFKRRYEV